LKVSSFCQIQSGQPNLDKIDDLTRLHNLTFDKEQMEHFFFSLWQNELNIFGFSLIVIIKKEHFISQTKLILLRSRQVRDWL